MQVTKKDGSDKTILPVLAIEDIENVNGMDFKVHVDFEEFAKHNPDKKWLHMPSFGLSKKKDQMKTMSFNSEHLQLIKDAFKKVRLRALEREEELNELVK